MSALPDPQPIPSEVRDAGLGLWWLADKVRDSVNAKPSDDVPPQA